MPQYLNLADFKTASAMASEYIDEVELRYPGFVDGQLARWSERIDARLRKRYDVPFVAPYSLTLTGWLASIVTWFVYRKRGFDATDKEVQTYTDEYNGALKELQEAADGVESLLDLPLRADLSSSALKKPKTRVYSEQSPYAFTDLQGQQGHEEDRGGNGGVGG